MLGLSKTPGLGRMQGLGKMPGLGMTQDTAIGAVRTGVDASGILSFTHPAAASFRTGWQSLLASLNSGMAVSDETEADQGPASAAPAAGQISEKSSVSTQAAGIRLRQGQGTEKQSVETGAVAKLSSAGAGTQAMTSVPAAVITQPALTSTEENHPAAKPETESVRGSRPSRSTNTTMTDAVSADALPVLLPAAMASLSQVAPAASVVNQVAQSRDDLAQLVPAEISAALSTGQQSALASASVAVTSASPVVASATYGKYLPVRENPSNHGEAVNATTQQTAEGPETLAQQIQASPVSSLSGSSALSETEFAAADKTATPAVAMFAESGNSLDTPVPALNLHQAEAPNPNTDHTLALVQTPAPNPDPAQTAASYKIPVQAATVVQHTLHTPVPVQISSTKPDQALTLASNQNPAQTATPSQSTLETLASVQTSSPKPEQAQIFASNQNPAQSATPSQNTLETPTPVETSSLKPDLAQTLASYQNPVQTATPSQNTLKTPTPVQTSSLKPDLAQTFASKQNPAQTATPSQNTLKTPAPVQTPSPKPEPAQTIANSQNSTQRIVTSRNLMQPQVASQSLTQTVAPSQSPTETEAHLQDPTPALTPNQNRTQTLVQGGERVAIPQGSQGVNVIAGDGLNPMPLIASAAAQSGLLSAPSPVLIKPVSSGGGKTLTPESIHGSSNIDSVQTISHLTAGQSSVPAVDASAMTRALAGTGGTVSVSAEPAGASSVMATGPDSREAFATLDGAGAPAATTWIHAGTQRAEAGYQDPALGWVGVRADLSGGGVHAQLVPVSADAAQALGGHLAGMNAYLDEHHTPVETLTLTAPESAWTALGSGQGTGEGMQQGAGQQSAQGADANTLSGQSSEPVSQSPAASAELPAFFGDMDGSTQAASWDGFHISVMA